MRKFYNAEFHKQSWKVSPWTLSDKPLSPASLTQLFPQAILLLTYSFIFTYLSDYYTIIFSIFLNGLHEKAL